MSPMDLKRILRVSLWGTGGMSQKPDGIRAECWIHCCAIGLLWYIFKAVSWGVDLSLPLFKLTSSLLPGLLHHAFLFHFPVGCKQSSVKRLLKSCCNLSSRCNNILGKNFPLGWHHQAILFFNPLTPNTCVYRPHFMSQSISYRK